MPAKTFPAAIEEFLWHIGARRDVTYDAVARLATERFGSAAPTVDEIATFIGVAYRGKVNLNRLHRDRAVARWLRENAGAGTIRDLRCALVDRFGPDRTPSASSIHRFLAAQPGPSLTRRKRWADLDAELAAWVLAHRDEQTLDALHAACVAKFGAGRTPSRSTLHRFVGSRQTYPQAWA